MADKFPCPTCDPDCDYPVAAGPAMGVVILCDKTGGGNPAPGGDFEQNILCDSGNLNQPFISRVLFNEAGDLIPDATGTFALDGVTPYTPIGPVHICSDDVCLPPIQFCFTTVTTSDVEGRMFDLTFPLAQGFDVESIFIDLVEFPLNIEWEVTDSDASEFRTNLRAAVQSRFPGLTVTVTGEPGIDSCGEPVDFMVHVECADIATAANFVQLQYNAGRDLVQNPAYRENPDIDTSAPECVNFPDAFNRGGYRLLQRADNGGTLLCTSTPNRGWESNDRFNQFEVWCDTGVTQASNVTPTPRGTPVQEINANGASDTPGDGIQNGDPDTVWQTFVATDTGPFTIQTVIGGRTGTERFRITLSTGDTNDTGIGDLLNDNIDARQVTNQLNPWTVYERTVNLNAGQTYTLALRGPDTGNPSLGGLFTDLRAFQSIPGERKSFTNNDDTCVRSVTSTTRTCEFWSPTCVDHVFTHWTNAQTQFVMTNTDFWAQSPGPECCFTDPADAGGGAELGNLPYSDLVCGVVGGRNRTLIRQVITDQAGGVIDTRFVGSDGQVVTPTTWQPGPCGGEVSSSLEMEPACYRVNANPTVIIRGYRIMRIGASTAEILYYFDAATGTATVINDATVVDCASEADPIILCDDNGQFVRHFTYGFYGNIVATYDTLLDGTTAYTTVGTIVPCAQDIEITSECYQANNNGVGYAIDDRLAQVTFWNASSNPPEVLVTLWRNNTQGTTLTANPITADIEPCSSGKQREILPVCFVEIANGTPHTAYKVVEVEDDIVTTLFYWESDNGIVHQVGDVVEIECTKEMDPITLCDDNGPFLRHVVYGSYGNIVGTRDTRLDGTTTADNENPAFAVEGDVHVCETNCFETKIAEGCYEKIIPGATFTGNFADSTFVSNRERIITNWQGSGVNVTMRLVSGGTSINASGGSWSDVGGTSRTVEMVFSEPVLLNHLLVSDLDAAGNEYMDTFSTQPTSLQNTLRYLINPPNARVSGSSNNTAGRIFWSAPQVTNIRWRGVNPTNLCHGFSELSLTTLPTNENGRYTTVVDCNGVVTSYDSESVIAIDLNTVTIIPCPCCESHILCDDNGSFIRRMVDGVPTDFELDGITAYTPVGTVGICQSPTILSQEYCWNNGGLNETVRRIDILDRDGNITSSVFYDRRGTVVTPAANSLTIGVCNRATYATEVLDVTNTNYQFLGALSLVSWTVRLRSGTATIQVNGGAVLPLDFGETINSGNIEEANSQLTDVVDIVATNGTVRVTTLRRNV